VSAISWVVAPFSLRAANTSRAASRSATSGWRREVRVTVKSTRRRGSWLARIWVAAALLFIAGGVATVVYTVILHRNPIAQTIPPKLEPATRIDWTRGADGQPHARSAPRVAAAAARRGSLNTQIG
jgi:hypothetical protein